MFDQVDDVSRREKCFTTISSLPAYVEPKQIPKRPPFSTIQNHPLLHSVELILPKETYDKIKPSLAKLNKPRYARVFMPPSSLLGHEFFNTYIKSGNILMISEGSSGSDNFFTLRDGILRMELGKEIYERTGLTGKVIRSGGRKHAKERYLVELNLRLPSMLHGKKGFERIVWAFSNVLTQSVAWLFHDLEDTTLKEGAENKPIHQLQPQLVTCEANEVNHTAVVMPHFQEKVEDMTEGEAQEYCGNLAEWLALVQMGSTRVQEDDIDPYLSRYAVPDAEETPADLVSLKWRGLISSQWVTELFLLAQTRQWFALAASSLGKEAVEGKDGLTVLKEGTNVICWETVGASIVQ
ncbi:hypothetical protein N7541_003069 [Penicillium brevicompactum]|uniref:Uncharacterized protein n=1 Tax=Penicillium brevicompactum TaxID=5074 RepID=A0A9W9RL45_PENBR|nr:hypothetical protein N7541_003069 [Penicillium brevicompactum]